MKYPFLLLPFLSASLAANTLNIDTVVEHKNQHTHEQKNTITEVKAAQQDLLNQAELENQENMLRQKIKEIAGNQELLEQTFANALIVGDNKQLPHLIEAYRQKENRDDSLIEWAEAILLTEKDLTQSIELYRKLNAHFPDNPYLRFQLAHTLYKNQDYEAARTQFEKLRSDKNMGEEDRKSFDRFIQAIDQKDRWNFSLSATYLNDDNLGNTAKPGTAMTVGNGIVKSGERYQGRGFSARFNIDKQWSLGGGQYLSLESGQNLRYYGNNKKFNELNFDLSMAWGYRQPQYQFEVKPQFSKKLYGGGSSGQGKLKSHYNTYGLSLSGAYWLNNQLKYSAYYDFSHDQYTRKSYAQSNDGNTHSLSQSLTYYANPKQYWSASLDLSHRHARAESNRYNRVGLRAGWGQEWPLGFSSYMNVGVAKRHYLGNDWFAYKQSNHEYSAGLMLWHKAVHYQGLTPRLRVTYHKTDSNVPIYSYDKIQAFIEVSKSF